MRIYKKRDEYQARVLRLLSDYLTISKIAKLLSKSPKTIYKLFLTYRKKGWINEDRTLTKEGCEKLESTIAMCENIEKKDRISLYQSNNIRLHNLVFTIFLKEPIINRDRLLNMKQISYKKINLGNWETNQIVVDNTKVWLNPNKIITYMGSYYDFTPLEAFTKALDDLKLLCIKLEKILSINLIDRGFIDFKVSKQHYSLIHNQLAEQYNKDKKKLYVLDSSNKLRLIIDDSLDLNEFEAVDKELSQEDSTEVQDYFKDILEKKHLLPSQEKTYLDQIIKNEYEFSENLRKHLSVLDKISSNIDNQNKIFNKIEHSLRGIKKEAKIRKKYEKKIYISESQKTLKEFQIR